MTKNGEMRQDKATRRRVIYSPSRRKRPKNFDNQKMSASPFRKKRDEGCPFCPGNERMLPPVILELSGVRLENADVVPNKFPALTPGGDLERQSRGIYVAMGGFGRHEIVIGREMSVSCYFVLNKTALIAKKLAIFLDRSPEDVLKFKRKFLLSPFSLCSVRIRRR
jgi:galactose-1-phosphate uridylyltransferase